MDERFLTVLHVSCFFECPHKAASDPVVVETRPFFAQADSCAVADEAHGARAVIAGGGDEA